MANVILQSNTNRSALTIGADDDLYLNGYTLTLDADLECYYIFGGNSETPTGAGQIFVPAATRTIKCKCIGWYNSTAASMFVFTPSANLTLELTGDPPYILPIADCTRLVNSQATNTITLTIKTPDNDNATIIECPPPPVSFTSSLVNVSSSNSVVNLRGIFRGQQYSTNARPMFTFGSSPTVSVSGCLIGGTVNSSCNVISTAGGGLTVQAFTTGTYANKALIAKAASPVVLTASGSDKQITITGDIVGSDTAGIFGLSITQSYQKLTVNGNVYGGSAPSGQPIGLYVSTTTSIEINGNLYGGSAAGGYTYGGLIGGIADVTINGRCIGGTTVGSYGILFSGWFGTATITTPSSSLPALQGSTGSTTAGCALSGTTSGTLTVNGNVVGGSNVNAAGLIILDGMVISIITINGNVISGTSGGAAGIRQVNAGAARIYINGNVIGNTTQGIYIAAGLADYYVSGDIVKQGSAKVLDNDSSSVGSYVCVAYGKGYKDGSGNPLTLADVADTNDQYPNGGLGYVVNAKLMNATDFITAMTQLPYGQFLLGDDLTISSTSYTPTNFFGSLFAVLTSSPKKIASLTLSNGGTARSLFTNFYGLLENIRIDAVSQSGATVFGNIGTSGNYSALVKRTYVRSGSASGLFGTIGSGATVSECYTRAGYIASLNSGTVDRCYHAVESNNIGTPLNDTQAKQRTSYVGWNFQAIWDIDEGNDYPFLNYRYIPPQEPQSSLPKSWALPTRGVFQSVQYKPSGQY